MSHNKHKRTKIILVISIALGGIFAIFLVSARPLSGIYINIPRIYDSATMRGYSSDKQLHLAQPGSPNINASQESSMEEMKSSALGYYDNLSKQRKGKVPILIYHHICEKHHAVDITLSEFRNHLKFLYEKGFRPIGLQEFMTFDFKLKKGQKPYIITFDDGWADQFSVIESESENLIVSMDCAVGVMLDFHKEHPDFNLRGVFYISLDKIPFGQRKYVSKKLNYLMDLGFEIGNHTMGHDNLASIPLDEYDESIHEYMKRIDEEIGFRSSMVKSLAFPYGSIPKDIDKWEYLRNYSYKDDSHSFTVFMSCERRLCPIPSTEDFQELNNILPRIPVTNKTIYSLADRNDIYTVN